MIDNPEKLARKMVDELDPLLDAIEASIVAGDPDRSRELSLEMLALVLKYADVLERDTVRKVLNGPKANAIAARLGVQPIRLH